MNLALYEPVLGCGSSKLNVAEFSMQEALSLDSSAVHGVVFDRLGGLLKYYERKAA